MSVSQRSIMKRRAMWGLFALMMSAGTAHAQDLEVTDAQLRLLPGDLPAAGYFTLHNAGSDAVTLSGAESAAFAMTHMHLSTEEDGMASMKSVDQLEVATDETLEFAPGGYHLMFMKRQQPLEVGDEVEVTLQFEDQPPLPVTFEVVSPASM
ncbi:copper chaperone PCu(A)C [Halomonas huangheensis]|uniref:Copper(I)-binding protein n=1 Tax=Halomonas huangheensis TaxID=1178482 RepID=W1ND86_9GAMM|nr:copper chaperone PCu(A)C [Halomonas huangheensis]ALM52978.1 copper resistance protein CopZ [Halomonas huangheensis]ERL53095.1 hypothetical protein BJB45_17620 [Halomonas huangheensis]